MKALAPRLVLTLATGILLGGSFVVAKMILAAGLAPATVAFVQMGASGLVLAAVLALRGRALPWGRETLRYFATSAIIGVFALSLLGNWVLSRIPAGIFTLLVTLSPMFTALFGALLDRRAPPLHTIAGAGLGLAGVALVLVPRAQAVSSEQAFALFVALGVPILLAVGNVYRSRRWPKGLGAPAASAGTLVTQGALLAPMFFAQSRAASVSVTSLWPLLALLVAVTLVGNVAGSSLQRIAGAAAYSQIGYVIALTGVVASALLFGESLGMLFWPALALVFAGVVLTNRAAGSAPAPPALRTTLTLSRA